MDGPFFIPIVQPLPCYLPLLQVRRLSLLPTIVYVDPPRYDCVLLFHRPCFLLFSAFVTYLGALDARMIQILLVSFRRSGCAIRHITPSSQHGRSPGNRMDETSGSRRSYARSHYEQTQGKLESEFDHLSSNRHVIAPIAALYGQAQARCVRIG